MVLIQTQVASSYYTILPQKVEVRLILGSIPIKHGYLDWALNESMRTMTVTPRIGRIPNQDILVNGTYVVPKGIPVMMALHEIHHDKKLWGDPEVFRPERFDPTSDEFKSRHRYAFMPFGGGARKCIGYRFALMEMKTALIVLYRKFKFTIDTAKTSEPVRCDFHVTQDPIGGVYMKAHLRTDFQTAA